MSLLNTLKAIKDEGFDPKKDKINGNGGGLLGSGTYPVRLISSEMSANKAGYEQIVVQLEVVSGNDAGRKEMIFLNFHDDLPDFVKEKNSKILLKLAEYAKVEFTEKDLKDELTTAEALQRGIGNQLRMELKIVPNKKNPDYPYRNYEFDTLDHDLSDEDLSNLPF